MKWFANLFGKKPAGEERLFVDSMWFDTSGWTLQECTKDEMLWLNEDGDALSFVLVRKPPDLPALSDVDALRNVARDLATDGGKDGGIVSGEVVEMQGLHAFALIYKYERLPAYAYTGMAIFPFREFYYVAAVSSVERGMTGVRDAYVTGQMAERGELEIEEFEEPAPNGSAGRIKGWFRDPYDPGYEGRVLRSIADDEKYDSLFPKHPLTKVRKLLEQMRQTLSYDDEILHAGR